jgi:hypothetical protein
MASIESAAYCAGVVSVKVFQVAMAGFRLRRFLEKQEDPNKLTEHTFNLGEFLVLYV